MFVYFLIDSIGLFIIMTKAANIDARPINVPRGNSGITKPGCVGGTRSSNSVDDSVWFPSAYTSILGAEECSVMVTFAPIVVSLSSGKSNIGSNMYQTGSDSPKCDFRLPTVYPAQLEAPGGNLSPLESFGPIHSPFAIVIGEPPIHVTVVSSVNDNPS